VARAALERAFYGAHSRLVGALLARLGTEQIDLVANVVQEAMVRALERWPADGVPDNAPGWLFRTAHHLAIDTLRREQRFRARIARGDWLDEPEAAPAVGDELALMFLACEPRLSRASQIALTLKLVCGFSSPQIARAFFTDAETVAQRIVRAKQRLREMHVRFELPDADEMIERIEPIMDVLYLVFTEGYSPSDGDDAVNDHLCAEALRLAGLLTADPRTDVPAIEALRALFCFQASRLGARIADDGSLLLLPEQDRSRWDAALIKEGLAHLGRAASGESASHFHLEAGIAACHACAPSYQATDWPQIVFLYDALRRCAPSPIVEVNRAMAIAMLWGAATGIDELDAIPERDLLGRYPYALVAYAELHTMLGNLDDAKRYLRQALAHQPVRAQRLLLERKLRALGH
jgi:RNA polymerase sigma-70 factor (ECF subfamily)